MQDIIQGNYYDVGATKGFWGHFKLDVNYFRRYITNFAEVSQSENLRRRDQNRPAMLGPVNGFVSYSYLVGSASLPVVGGLFLGEDANDALSQIKGRFWISQDQRNTLRSHSSIMWAPRWWVAVGASYGSGLPRFTSTVQESVWLSLRIHHPTLI